MWYIIACLVCLSAGLIIGEFLTHKKPVGTLRIDTSDPDGPYIFLELETDPRTFIHDKYITLKINTTNYVSPK